MAILKFIVEVNFKVVGTAPDVNGPIPHHIVRNVVWVGAIDT